MRDTSISVEFKHVLDGRFPFEVNSGGWLIQTQVFLYKHGIIIGKNNSFFCSDSFTIVVKQVSISVKPNIPHAKKKNGVPIVPLIKSFILNRFSSVDPVVRVESG